MSNRSMLEFNHDYAPHGQASIDAFLAGLRHYLSSGDPTLLPEGVTWFGMRHHSEPCSLGTPPRGWDNSRPNANSPAKSAE